MEGGYPHEEQPVQHMGSHVSQLHPQRLSGRQQSLPRLYHAQPDRMLHRIHSQDPRQQALRDQHYAARASFASAKVPPGPGHRNQPYPEPHPPVAVVALPLGGVPPLTSAQLNSVASS